MPRKTVKSKLVEVKVIRIVGVATVVSFWDKEGMIQARVVSSDDAPGLRVGHTGVISDKVLETGTEYGIDWEIFLGNSDVIKPIDLEQEFRRRGLWTYEDINTNSPQVMAALGALSKRVYVGLMSEARKVKLEAI